MIVESTIGLSSEAVVRVGIVSVVGDDENHLFVLGRTSHVRTHMLHRLASTLNRTLQLASHGHGHRGETTLIWHVDLGFVHTILGIVFVHRVD